MEIDPINKKVKILQFLTHLEHILHLIGFPLWAPSMIRLLTMSARGRPLLPESWFLFLSGDMKSRGCLSGVNENGEDFESLSDKSVLSGRVFLPGVSGVSEFSTQNDGLSLSFFGVENSVNNGVIGVIAWRFVTECFSSVGVNAEWRKAFTWLDIVSPRLGVSKWDTGGTLDTCE